MSLLWLLFLFTWESIIKFSWMRCIHDDIAAIRQDGFDYSGGDFRAPEAGSVLYRDTRDAVASSDHHEEAYQHDDAATSNHSEEAHQNGSAASNHSQEAYQPLRVHVHYVDTALLGEDRWEMVKTAVQQALLKIRSVLSVIPVTDSLLLPRTCSVVISRGINKGRCSRMPKGYSGEFCLDFLRIPQNHLGGLYVYNRTSPDPVKKVVHPGPGIENADIILYVMSMVSEHCSLDQSVAAFASHCRVDKTGRPIAGLINFCPSAVMKATVTHHLLYTTALHEIIHVLGFSTRLFSTFQDCKGESCEKRAYVRVVGGQYRLIAPNVVNQTRQHFGCHSDKYFGAPLQAKDSAVTSHWSSLMMYTSLMTAEVEKASYPVLDPITLAVLEDSGWYKVNFSNADSFLWGKDAGCLFALPDHCLQNTDYFCSDNFSSDGCHFLLRDKAACVVIKTESPCGVYAPIPQGSCTQNVTENEEGNTEMFSTSSRCFLSSVSTPSAHVNKSGEEAFVGQCYERRCSENGTVHIRLQGTGWIHCPAGQFIQIPGFQGQLQCPNNTDILCMGDSVPPSFSASPNDQGASTLPTKSNVTETTVPCCVTDSDRHGAGSNKPASSVQSCLVIFVFFVHGYQFWW